MTSSRPIAAFIALCFAATLAACESPLQKVNYPELRFNHLPAINLDVAKIIIVEKYRAPLRAPNVEHEIPLAPATAMANWARDRLRAVGTVSMGGTATFTILNASVTAQALAKKPGLKAAFTYDQAARYETKLSARLDIETAGGLGKGIATAKASRQRTTPENLTTNERDDVLYSFVEAAATDFDRVMTQNIDNHLGLFRR